MWAILYLWAHKFILFLYRDQWSLLPVTWIKWRADEKVVSFAVSSHFNWDVCCRENGVGLIVLLVDKQGERWLLWLSLRPPTSPRQQKTACMLYMPGAHPPRNQDNCPFDPLSHVTHLPPHTSSGRVYLPFKVNQLFQYQKISLSQRSFPFLRAPIFQTRLWTISIWNTEAWFLIRVSEKGERKFSLS